MNSSHVETYYTTKFRKIRKRVLTVIPDWYKWPRMLRILAASLADFGTSEAAIEDFCERRGFKLERLQKHISDNPSFQVLLDTFKSTGQYPQHPRWKNPLAKAHVQMLVAEGEAFGQFMDIIDLRAAGQSGALAKKTVEHMGWMDTLDPVEEQPEVRIYDGVKVTGMVIEDEDVREIKRREWEDDDFASLSNWNLASAELAEHTLP